MPHATLNVAQHDDRAVDWDGARALLWKENDPAHVLARCKELRMPRVTPYLLLKGAARSMDDDCRLCLSEAYHRVVFVSIVFKCTPSYSTEYTGILWESRVEICHHSGEAVFKQADRIHVGSFNSLTDSCHLEFHFSFQHRYIHTLFHVPGGLSSVTCKNYFFTRRVHVFKKC